METQHQSETSIDAQALQWMHECLDVTRRKTAALMQNDLAAIEDCLEKEAALVSTWSEVTRAKRFAGEGRTTLNATALVRETLKALALEIKSQNLRNSALTKAGMDFSQTLLGVLLPSATYATAIKGETAIASESMQPIISVKC